MAAIRRQGPILTSPPLHERWSRSRGTSAALLSQRQPAQRSRSSAAGPACRRPRRCPPEQRPPPESPPSRSTRGTRSEGSHPRRTRGRHRDRSRSLVAEAVPAHLADLALELLDRTTWLERSGASGPLCLVLPCAGSHRVEALEVQPQAQVRGPGQSAISEQGRERLCKPGRVQELLRVGMGRRGKLMHPGTGLGRLLSLPRDSGRVEQVDVPRDPLQAERAGEELASSPTRIPGVLDAIARESRCPLLGGLCVVRLQHGKPETEAPERIGLDLLEQPADNTLSVLARRSGGREDHHHPRAFALQVEVISQPFHFHLVHGAVSHLGSDCS
jgi:hypothetical protein